MKSANGINLTMLCDFYELTMGNGYLDAGIGEKICCFDVFFRDVPDGGGFAVAAGLEQIVDYIQNLHFDAEDIAYLRSRGIFREEFLNYLSHFRFTGDVWAVPEGTPIFPREPVITVRASAIQAQLIETYLLLEFNHQSLVATKANRVCRAAEGRAVMEFGSRRAQGIAGAVVGARAAYIGGCAGTACTVSDPLYGVKALGTMAGVPNAIRAFNEVLRPLGITSCGIRFDSGDMAYLTKQARKMLDEAGWPGCKITVSNSLDEWLIADLLRQGARIDSFGVGERLITSKSSPVFGGVYKLCAVEGENGELVPKIKISENVGKITNPGFKKVYRFYNRSTGMAEADYICLRDETVDDSKPLEICDPDARWKRKTMENFVARELLVPIFEKGKLVYDLPSLPEIKAHCEKEVASLWPEVRRFENPHGYYVDLSEKLMALKDRLLEEGGGKI